MTIISRRIASKLLAGLIASSSMTLAGCATSAEEALTQSPVPGVHFRMIETNGIKLRVAETGTGPLVVMLHGWPESWYSWRHQMKAVAAAGYHVIAPDLRGYGKSDKPPLIEDYDIKHMTADIVGLLDALGERTAIIIGHDVGAQVTWNAVLLYPDRFTAMIAMSVPYGGRASAPPLAGIKATYGDNFFYMLYHQEPGVAEAEYDADPRGLLLRVYSMTGTPLYPPEVTDPKASAGGLLPRFGMPKQLPAWLSEEELDYLVSEYKEAGFRGGVNTYRNIDRNWYITPELAGARIKIPVGFVAGADDHVIAGRKEPELRATMQNVVDDLRAVKIIPNAGHWIQQDKADDVTSFVLAFLADIKK